MPNHSVFLTSKELINDLRLHVVVLKKFRIEYENLISCWDLYYSQEIVRSAERCSSHCWLSIYSDDWWLKDLRDGCLKVQIIDNDDILLMYAKVRQWKIFLSIRWYKFVVLKIVLRQILCLLESVLDIVRQVFDNLWYATDYRCKLHNIMHYSFLHIFWWLLLSVNILDTGCNSWRIIIEHFFQHIPWELFLLPMRHASCAILNQFDLNLLIILPC